MQHHEPLMFMGFCENDRYFLDDEPHSPTEMMMMKKEHKDAELDKKIEALRKKNEALMKRYQEVEEDKKRAEQEEMSFHSRKGKPDDLTITINKSLCDERVVTQKVGGLRDGGQEKDCDPGSSVFSIGRGKRRQLLISTPGNIKGKKVFGERKDRNRPVSPARLKSCVEEDLESNTRGKQPAAVKRLTEVNAGKQDQWSPCERSCSVPSTEPVADLNLMPSEQEQQEYLRWKKEREEIDRERVARHKNSKGQWRRAWDMEKTELMFSEKEHGGVSNRGSRNARRGNLRSEESRARHQASDRKGKSVSVVCSKAKGKDRLTGRARRWDAKEQEEHLQVYPEGSLQEFLEELDALCAPEKINPETDTENIRPCSSQESLRSTEHTQNTSASAETPHPELVSLKNVEKKVRFSEDHEKKELQTNTNGFVEENRQTSTQNSSENHTESDALTEERKTSCPEAGDISAEADEKQPAEHSKSCTARGNELLDSDVCVLTLERSDVQPKCSSVQMAKENGKVV
ncbi:coiled-coil domain-containing protein 9B isoform X2 [Danio rerio]|uniref:Coiled-coil domain-containing protein 9B isoform X2 n=2 Tax=Danio rerio TaxID=7955 RepID=A0AC58HQ55_DANRE